MEETTPPEGYRKADNAQPYYFYFSSEEDTAHTLPATLPAGAVDLSADSKTVYVENVKNTTEITVKKEWLDEGGNVETGSHEPITLELYRSTTKNSGSGGGSGEPVTITATASGSNVDESKINAETVTVGSTIQIKVEIGYTIPSDWTWRPNISISGAEVVSVPGWVLSDSSASGHSTYTYNGLVTGNIGVTVSDEQLNNIASITVKVLSGSSVSSLPDDSSDIQIGEDVILSSSNGWTQTITALPLSEAGEDGTRIDYYYYFKEVNVPAGYSVSYSNGSSGVQEGTVTVTNQKQTIVTYTSATVRKAWQDVNGTAINGSDASLPESIQVYLLRTKDGTTERVDASGNTGDAAQPYALTKEAGWTLTINGLSTDYTYSFEEVAVKGYTSTITTAEDGATVITNKAQPDDTSLTVVKQWQDSSGNTLTSVPDSVTINLYQRATQDSSSGGGESGGGSGSVEYVSVTVGIKDENNSYVYVQDSSGTLASEKQSISVPAGTTITISLYNEYAGESWATKWRDTSATANGVTLTREEKDGGKTYIFTYKVADNTTIDVWKNWGSGAKATVTFSTTASIALLSDDEVVNLYQSVTLTVDNNWSYTFTGLPLSGKDDDGNTVTYTYYVVENRVYGYDTTYENNTGITSGTIKVTNRKNPTETPSYELPETGSGGTFLYTMGGAALVALSLLLATCPRRRGERRVRH